MEIGKQFVWAKRLRYLKNKINNPKLAEQLKGFQDEMFQLKGFIEEFAETTA